MNDMEMTIQEMRQATLENTRMKFEEKIREAIAKGETSCYLVCSDNCPPREAIEELLEKGLDISYKVFHLGEWFIQAYWHDQANGRVFLRDSCKSVASNIDEMYSPTHDYR